MAQDQECPATVPSIVDSLVKAERAFGKKDQAGFATHRDTARRKLECLNEIMTPREVALYHRVQAYGFYLADEKKDTAASLRAARKIDPNFKLWSGFGPDAGVYAMWKEAAQASMTGAATIPVSAPGDALVYVDGQRALARPKNLPTLLQLVSLHGGVKSNRYVRTGAEGPSWARAAEPEPEVAAVGTAVPTALGDQPITKAEAGVSTASTSGVAAATRERGEVKLERKGPRLRRTTAPLALSGVASAGLGYVLWQTALSREEEFNEPWHEFEYREDLQKRANSMGYAAQTLGLVGGGLVIGAAFTVDW
jgi:hypothetical protein